jgi:hypothetical protein
MIDEEGDMRTWILKTQQSPKRKVLLLAVAFVALLAAVMLACGNETEVATNTAVAGTSVAAKPGDVTATSEGTGAIASQHLEVGQGVTLSKEGNPTLEVSLNSTRWGTSELGTPEAGMKWLVVDMTFKNAGDEAEAISSMMQIRLVDDDGYDCDAALFTDTNGRIDGKVGPGMTMRGEEAFDVKEASKSWTLIFEPGMFDSTQVIWSIDPATVK